MDDITRYNMARYRHTLSTLINGLVASGFTLTRVVEAYLGSPDINAAPGSSEHFSAIAPPWLEFLATYQPGTPVRA